MVGRYTKNARRFPNNVRPGNIVKGLPIPDQCCDGVYASHILEHLTLEDFDRALQNTKRMLKPGGIFRLVVPDLEYSAREYVRNLDSGESTASTGFLTSTGLGVSARPAGLRSSFYQALRTSAHLWMWDALSLADALGKHGFGEVRRCEFGDCKDPMFKLVEEAGRFVNAVAMEARG